MRPISLFIQYRGLYFQIQLPTQKTIHCRTHYLARSSFSGGLWYHKGLPLHFNICLYGNTQTLHGNETYESHTKTLLKLHSLFQSTIKFVPVKAVKV